MFLTSGRIFGQDFIRNSIYSEVSSKHDIRVHTNILPWGIAVANVGAECGIGKKWSVVLDILYSPWKISDKFSVKTVALLPEGRWWLKDSRKGSFFSLHLNIAWFNVRYDAYRYQDTGRPLLGAGLGYGYRLPVGSRWSFDFEIGAGMANMRYDRFYNVENGALKDTRISTYWGIDRAAVSISYLIGNL